MRYVACVTRRCRRLRFSSPLLDEARLQAAAPQPADIRAERKDCCLLAVKQRYMALITAAYLLLREQYGASHAAGGAACHAAYAPVQDARVPAAADIRKDKAIR